MHVAETCDSILFRSRTIFSCQGPDAGLRLAGIDYEVIPSPGPGLKDRGDNPADASQNQRLYLLAMFLLISLASDFALILRSELLFPH